MLLPNNKQRTKLFECAGVARWAYNFALATQQENHKNGGKFLSDGELRKRLTELKKQKEYDWLNKYSNNITKQAIKDACQSYKNFFEGRTKFPKFKSKKRSRPSFYVDTAKIKITDTHVKLEKLTTSKKSNKQKLNYIKLAEKCRIPIGNNTKYSNPRVTFDGLNWWLSIGVEEVEAKNQNYTEGIGIDLGVKDLAVINDGRKIPNINKSQEIKRLNKKLKRLQRKLSRKYEKQKEGGVNRYKKTKNIIKLECLIRKVHKRIKDIRTNYLHQETAKLVKTKPEFVCMEDLNVKGMVKNHKLSKSIQEQTFSEFRRIIEYKCKWNNIRFIVADRYYPSSKTCSECGYVLDKLSLSTRKWVCPECGVIHDRDINAAINLMKYGKSA
jgi:putative transposase